MYILHLKSSNFVNSELHSTLLYVANCSLLILMLSVCDKLQGNACDDGLSSQNNISHLAPNPHEKWLLNHSS